MWSVSILSNTRLFVQYRFKDDRQITMLFVMRIPTFIQMDSTETMMLMNVPPTEFHWDPNNNLNPFTGIRDGERYGNIAVKNNRLVFIPVTQFTEFTSLETVKKPVLVHSNFSPLYTEEIVSLSVKD